MDSFLQGRRAWSWGTRALLLYRPAPPPANGAELSACPFVPPLVLLAAYNSRDLIIEAPVSQVLLDHLRGVLALWHQSDRNATLIDVTAVPVALTRRASAAASFFSGGVDSFYSVIATDSRYGSSDPRFIRFLIFCQGFDIPLDDLRRAAHVRANLERAAGDLGKELVTVRTNARDFVKSARVDPSWVRSLSWRSWAGTQPHHRHCLSSGVVRLSSVSTRRFQRGTPIF